MPLTATVSGNWTAPMLWFQAGRTVIGATIGSSSFGLGFSAPDYRIEHGATGEQADSAPPQPAPTRARERTLTRLL